MKLKKILGVFALSAVLVCSLGGVVGCSNTEQLIRDSLTEEINQYKNVDESAIEEIDQAIPATQMEMLGLNSEELAKAILSGRQRDGQWRQGRGHSHHHLEEPVEYGV